MYTCFVLTFARLARKCTHHYCCPARCTHFDCHQPAYSQFSCAPSVISCLFSMPACGCVRLCALKLLACCARYSALRRSLPHLTRVALLMAMRSRPLCTTLGCERVYLLELLGCCARCSALQQSLSRLTRAALLSAMRTRPVCTARCLGFQYLAQCVGHALRDLACCASSTLASSRASHCKQCLELMSHLLHACGCASPSRTR